MATNREGLNRANPSTLADYARALAIGDVLRALPCYLYGKQPALGNAYAGSTLLAYTTPSDAKCLAVLYCYARAGTGTKGPIAYQATMPPGASEYCITQSGDVVFNTGDAWTAVDMVYIPHKGDAVELTLSVVANVATVPSAWTTRGVVQLQEVESLAGGLQAKMLVMAPGATPISGQAALALAKGTVVFAAADAVTQCRVKLTVAPSTDVNALLESTDSAFV